MNTCRSPLATRRTVPTVVLALLTLVTTLAALPRASSPAPQAAAPAIVAPAEAVSRVDAFFARYETTESPGCAVGVSLGGRPVLTRAYGMADIEQERPNRTDTVFEAGSVSKQFTAAAILLLAQDGKLSLDDPVRKYVPELPDYGTPLTIRHALTHTSGLRDWGSVVDAAGWPRTSRVHTHAHVLDVASRQQSLNFTPGAEYSYCNTGYNLAAIIVSRVSGEPFAEFTRKRIFEPLGMTRTEWRDDYTRIVKDRATAYSPRPGGWRINMPFENVHGNGGLLTTVGDLLTWNENFVHATVGGPAFVARQQQRARLNSGKDIEYAAGLFVTSFRGVREVSHSGSTAGYRAFLTRYPDQRLSVAVLCNAASANATALAHQVAEVYLGKALAPVTTIRTVTLDAATLAARAGLYRQEAPGPSGVLRLVIDNGGLRIESGPALIPTSPVAFVAGDSDLRVEFDLDGNGRATAARFVSPNGDARRFVAERPASPTSEDLRAYVGHYRSDEAETEIVATADDGALVLRQRPDRVFRMRPAWRDAFTGPIGMVIFRRTASGAVEGLSLVESRMYDLRFARIENRAP